MLPKSILQPKEEVIVELPTPKTFIQQSIQKERPQTANPSRQPKQDVYDSFGPQQPQQPLRP
jgi:hypothetical protein